MLLNVNNLRTVFLAGSEVNTAVDGVSFSLESGMTLGIVGESGSGKSVTALTIMRLLPASIARVDSGSIVFNPGKGISFDLLNIGEDAMRRVRGKEIAMIFQEPMTSLNPVMRCGNQLVEMMVTHLGLSRQEARSRSLDLFAEVKLPDPARVLRSYPHQLSGGQRQRVMIAMALSCNPSLLIADEPTTALDVTVQKGILLLMKSLQEKYGMAILFITHDLAVVKGIADETMVMYKGKVVEQGPTAGILGNPRHPYTRGLIQCKPQPGLRLRELPTVESILHIQDESQTISNIRVVTDNERVQRHRSLYARDPLLSMQDVNVSFDRQGGWFSRKRPQTKAVDGITFDVYAGETLGLVGESGCGKTTLGRSILRLVEIQSGKIIYKGQAISDLSASQFRKFRKNMQIIFQDPYSSLNPRITIGNCLTEPMRVHGIGNKDSDRKERALALLEKVKLEPSHFYRYPHEFSGGQRQRVCIARALTLEPEFIVCDESVSALDVSVQAQVLNLLNNLREEFGFTYIFISHDLNVVRFMADRLIVMRAGRIVEMGEADEIYQNPAEEYTRSLIAAIPG